jgi:hypothetical protein
MSKTQDPLGTPAIWREFLFNSVLLTWQAGLLTAKTGDFDKRFLDTELGLLVLRKNRLREMDAAEAQFSKHPDEFLVIYREGPGWSTVFKSLRDMTAHGDFSSHKRGWITIRHRYKGPREKFASTRLFGSLKFQTLKALVQFINVSPTPKTP